MQTGPEFLLSVSSYKGILYFENLGEVQLKEPPCSIFVEKSLDFLELVEFANDLL